MWDFSGIVNRIWTVGGFITLLGISCMLVSEIGRKDFNKSCFGAGVFCTLVGIAFAIYFASCILFPKVDSFRGTFEKRVNNTRSVPYTTECRFYDAESKLHVAYLDPFSRKEMLPEDFIPEDEYIIYYETRSEVIVGVEKVEP